MLKAVFITEMVILLKYIIIIIIIIIMQETAIKFVYSRQQKMKFFSYLKDDNGKLWMEVIIFSFLDAVVTVDVLATINTDVKLIESWTLYILLD